MRLFIAINLPEELKAKIAKAVKNIDSPGLKKVGPENLHLTMKFLGEVDDKQLEAVKRKLGGIKGECFKISLEGFGFFPNENYIKVVWVGVEEGHQEIINLQKEIDTLLSEVGFAKEKNFEPHLTIARVKFLKDLKGLAEFAAKTKINATFEANSFELMESILRPGGPEYIIKSRFNLITD